MKYNYYIIIIVHITFVIFFLVLEIIKSAAEKKYSSSELVHTLKWALATILTKTIMFWKLVNSFTMMK